MSKGPANKNRSISKNSDEKQHLTTDKKKNNQKSEVKTPMKASDSGKKSAKVEESKV